MRFLPFILLLCCYVWPFPVHSAQNNQSQLDSLLQQLDVATDTTKVNLLIQVSNKYILTDVVLSMTYAEQALALAQKLNYQKGLAETYNRMADGYYHQNNYNKALEWHFKALELNKSLGNTKWIRLNLNNIGLVYHKQNNYPKTLEYYFKALHLSEQERDEKLVASSLNNIANVYAQQESYDKALEYYFKALEIRKTIFKTGRKVSQVLNNIGDIYTKQHHYQKAVDYFLASMEGLTGEDTDMKAVIMANLGIINGGMKGGGLGNYPKSLHYLAEALRLHKIVDDTYSMAYTLQAMAYVYQHTKDTKQSEKYARQALNLALSLENKTIAAELYLLLSELAESQENYRLAHLYHKNYVEAQESLNNETNTRRMAQLQANYEIDKKQAEIEILKKDSENEALLRNAIAAGLLATLIIAGLIVSRQRLKIRQNRLLLEKSEEVSEKNKQLQQQATILEKQAAELALQTEKLRELDQVKSNFFANISHEFRTPLTLILSSLSDKVFGSKDTYAEEVLPVKKSEISMMHRNARRLLQLINQLLDLSKVESGKMKLQPAAMDLTYFFKVMSASFSSLARFRYITFDLLLPEQPLYGLFDEDKLEKIVTNLLSNAFKFTADRGSIKMKVDVYEEFSGKPLLEVIVEDNGAGIPAEGLDKVFERFYQGNTYYSDGQGTGIGLALTKELVELHEGSIRVESEQGKGARFIVTMPFKYSRPIAKPGEVTYNRNNNHYTGLIENDTLIENLISPNHTEDFSATEKLSESLPAAPEEQELPLLLLVEDNEDLRLFIRSRLTDFYRIIESENGRKGVEKAMNALPDLIISDWMMPDMDGLQLCHKLKSDERTSHIPIILLTALANPESKLTGLQQGADEYLTKPFDARELEIRVKNLIDNRRKLRDRYSKQILLQPMDIEVTSTDEKFLQRVMQIVEEKMGDSDFGAEAFSWEVGMSRMQLHRKLTALTGQSTTDFLRTLRLKRAVKLLEAQTGNITEIAYEVGFNNLSYFAKCFREQYGMPPNEYINRFEAASHQ